LHDEIGIANRELAMTAALVSRFRQSIKVMAKELPQVRHYRSLP
jgi:hypothetical protein